MMNNIPKFITLAVKKKYGVEAIEFDLESSIEKAGLLIHSWGRINTEKASKVETENFSDDVEAAKKIKNLITSKHLSGQIIIVWSNALTAPIRCTVDFLDNFAIEIASEDWDFWIFSDHDWIIEKYHEGELVFVKV